MIARRHLRLVDPDRPVVRGDCVDAERPCVWRQCRHHMESDNDLGPLVIAAVSCSLDEAEKGPQKLREVGKLLGLSRERVRQIETIALEKLSHVLDPDMLAAWTRTHDAVGDSQAADVVDVEFRALVQKAYERIVPKDEQGAKAIRVGKRAGL